MSIVRKVGEDEISKAIINEALKELENLVDVDAVVVGSGPSGLTCSYYLAKYGLKTVLIERRLSFGGGIGGGGMLLPSIVIESPAAELIHDEFLVNVKKIRDGLYVMNPAEFIAKLASKAIDAGVKVLLGVSVEDVIFRSNPLRIAGVVINWSAVHISQLWVDPLFIKAKAVIDATGHDAEIVNIVSKKIPDFKLTLKGEKSACSIEAEDLIISYSGKVVEGLYVTGMATAKVYGLPRMGPIFGGMVLSGKKTAEEVYRDLSKELNR